MIYRYKTELSQDTLLCLIELQYIMPLIKYSIDIVTIVDKQSVDRSKCSVRVFCRVSVCSIRVNEQRYINECMALFT